jgi:hypothetical protein
MEAWGNLASGDESFSAGSNSDMQRSLIVGYSNGRVAREEAGIPSWIEQMEIGSVRVLGAWRRRLIAKLGQVSRGFEWTLAASEVSKMVVGLD